MHAHHIARKRFGQHFLHDKHIIQMIIDAIAPKPGDHIIEIGPGQGALTVPILKMIGQLTAIELDRDLIPALKMRCADKGILTIHQSDALEFDFNIILKEQKPIRLVGNLPYNISTPLLFHLLDYATDIIDMHFMLQKEVVERLAAKPHSDAYGRLSVMIQYHADVSILFDVHPASFYPPPQVESSVVRLAPHNDHKAESYKHFADIVRKAFSHRRKTLRNCLKEEMTDADWQTIEIDSHQRPEELGVLEYIKISNYYAGRQK